MTKYLHTMIRVSSLEDTIAFFEVLGLREIRRRPDEKGRYTNVFLAAPGDEGHEIIALVADRFLDPAVREKIAAMLAADPDNLTAHDIASATWADRYRDSDRNGSRQHYEQTWRWHFVNVELDDPNRDVACFGHPPLRAGTLASNGAARACVVDNINQYVAELADPRTDLEERLVALKFILHLVGDLHQPLHAADDHDAGGNRKRVVTDGFRHLTSST